MPDRATPWRRQNTLAVRIRQRRAIGTLNLLVYNTGIYDPGRGEYQTRNHEVQGRHQRCEVHLAMDPATSDIRAAELTPGRDSDSSVLPDLFGQFPEDEKVGTVTANDACDMRRCYNAIPAHEVTLIIPIRRTGGGGRKIGRQHVPETTPCAPPDIMSGLFGNAGLDAMPLAGPRQGCAARNPSANASWRGTRIARPSDSSSVLRL